jgi:LacI family transcriptional regulator
VIVDEQQGTASVVEHLRGLGRTRIAHVTGPEHHRSAAERASGVVDYAGTLFAGEVLFGDWSEQWGRQATDLLLRKHPDLDAITCGSDQIARGVCDRLRELGRSVPADIAVTGYDNWPVMALASRPPLTSVDLQLEELGRQSAQLLLDAIAGTRRHGTLELPTRLVPRESTLGS